MIEPLALGSSPASKQAQYSHLLESIQSLLGSRTDWVAAMATVTCELHHAFDYFHWTGFYRVVEDGLLLIGPYQGKHGCLEIPFSRGVCGAAARSRKTQLVRDVHSFPDHIACSTSTQSEIVVPLVNAAGELLAVLDVDSDHPSAFDEHDQQGLELICRLYAERFPQLPRVGQCREEI